MTEPTFAELLSFAGKVAVVTGAANGIGPRALVGSRNSMRRWCSSNLRATFTTAQACAREIVERGGAIVNIASA